MKNLIRRINPILVVLIFSLAFLFFATTSNADEGTSEWEYSAYAYMWGSQMVAKTPGGAEGEIPFYKILDNLKMTFMGGGGAQNDKWSIMTDIIYLDVKDHKKSDVEIPSTGLTVALNGSIEMKSWIVTPTVGYAVHNSKKARVEIIGGARYLSMESIAKIHENGNSIVDANASESYWDAILGMRAHIFLNDKWFVPLYFDVGTGDTDGTWQGFGGIGYRFAKYNTVFSYRYLTYDFDRSNKVIADLTVKGLFLGLQFSF